MDRMVPANQRFGARKRAGAEVDLRLVVQHLGAEDPQALAPLGLRRQTSHPYTYLRTTRSSRASALCLGIDSMLMRTSSDR